MKWSDTGEDINLFPPPPRHSFKFLILHVKLKNPILPSIIIVYFIIQKYYTNIHKYYSEKKDDF